MLLRKVRCEECGLLFEVLRRERRENLAGNKCKKCELLLLTHAICRILCVTQAWYFRKTPSGALGTQQTVPSTSEWRLMLQLQVIFRALGMSCIIMVVCQMAWKVEH